MYTLEACDLAVCLLRDRHSKRHLLEMKENAEYE
jgi:hypothetical protein